MANLQKLSFELEVMIIDYLYENSLQENYISIPIKEDFNIDVYVIGSKDGKFSKQSNIINVKI